ncbi:MAG: ParB/RepB/Spo0J family partition protein [Prevotellaceae bacterium]|jgi:ParB family chromosome partitioning protein|nr:ParB/RepB/Spo0J family partition protein [Prevotellaceae bacterium]
MTKKNALGKGLGALISADPLEQAKDIPVSVENYQIEISKIKANPDQPRTSFDEDSLTELSESIKIHGIIQPLTLRETGAGEYQIISGERRFRAARLAGLTTVPAYIRTANDQEMLEMALIENIQREDLDAIEIALTYKRLIDECKLTQDALSERVGKKRSTVTNYLRLLNLEDEIQEAIKEGKISMGHAKSLGGLETKIRKKLAVRIIDEGLSVRQIEEIVQSLTQQNATKRNKPEKPEEPEELPDKFCVLLELLDAKFNNKIQFKRNKNGEGGSIVINYASDEEIESFIKNLSI